MMNAEARRLGMNGTTFRNPNGLPDDGQYSTARDLAVLARAIWMRVPRIPRLLRDHRRSAPGNKVLRNYNTLLDHYRGANGMKTGLRLRLRLQRGRDGDANGRTLIAVVLGDTSAAARAETAAGLLNRGFNGGLGGLMGQNLANFRSRPSPAQPVNLHEEICGKDWARRSGYGRVGARARFVVMEPVRYSPAAPIPLAGRQTPRPPPLCRAVAQSTSRCRDHGRSIPPAPPRPPRIAQ